MLARSVGAEIRHGTHVAIRIIHDPARRMKRAPVRTLLRLALVAGLLVSATGCTTLQTPTQPWTTAHEFYENPYRYSRDTIIEATVAELLSNENLFDGRRIGARYCAGGATRANGTSAAPGAATHAAEPDAADADAEAEGHSRRSRRPCPSLSACRER